jgi:hypothetical protein
VRKNKLSLLYIPCDSVAILFFRDSMQVIVRVDREGGNRHA